MSASGIFDYRATSSSPAQTKTLARRIGKRLRGGEVLALSGPLGSGKTLFVQGLAEGLGVKDLFQVRSPTFSLIQEYEGRVNLCHADLYRTSHEEALHLGLEEYWQKIGQANQKRVTAIEWAERAEGLLPKETLKIQFEPLSPNKRKISFAGEMMWKKAFRW